MAQQEFQSRESQNLKISEGFNEASMKELERLAELEDVANRPAFKESMALYVVLTATNNTPGDDRSTTTKTWFNFYQRATQIFAKITCAKRFMWSKSNYGRPLIRKILGLGDSAETEAGGPGHKTSLYLWKLLESVALEVPSTYSEGLSAALFYLIAMDAGTSFDQIPDNSIEIPCFLEMFYNASSNNQKSLTALLSEYLAVIRICRYESYTGEQYWFEGESKTYDFSIIRNWRKIRYFSVKTINSSSLQHFTHHSNKGGLGYLNFISDSDESNIFLYDCCCDWCLKCPTRKIIVDAEGGYQDDLRDVACRGKQSLIDALNAVFLEVIDRDSQPDRSPIEVEIYLISGRRFFELRHAIHTFKQEGFRGHPFPLRDVLGDKLASIVSENFGGESAPNYGSESARGKSMETLRNRERDLVN